MSKAAKLIYIAFVTYLLISMNFSPRVNAQPTPAPSQLSCQNIPKPSIVVYSAEPFKPKKDGLEKGNAFLLYAIKDLKEITLEVKGLKDNNWQVVVTDPTKTNSIANRIPNTNKMLIKETGEYIIQTSGGDEKLELKAVDNSAVVNKVDNKRDLFIKIDSMKSKILQTQSYILGLLRKGYEADALIYDALDKAIKVTQTSAQKLGSGGAASLSITGRQVDVDTAAQSVKNARIFLKQKGQVAIPLGADFNQQIEITCSSPGSTTKILSQTLHQDNTAFWSQVVTKAQHIREVVAEPVEKGVGYVEKGEKLFSAFKVTTISDDAIPQTFVVRVPNSDTAVGVDVINSIKLAQDYGVAPKLITSQPIPVKLQCKVGGANVEKSYKVLAEEFVEGEYAADALASPTPKFSEYEVYRAIGEADGQLWVNTETTVNGEPMARLLTDIDLATIKVFRENGRVVAKYTDVEKVETIDFGSRLNSAGMAGKKLEFYLEGFIRQFSDEGKIKNLLRSSKANLPAGASGIVDEFLNTDLNPYLKQFISTRGESIETALKSGKKVILGVHHSTEEELTRVKNEITRHTPSKVGLELPEDYILREKHNLKTYFFGDLASHLRSAGIEVLPLENPELWDYHQAIELAKAILDGRLDKTAIEIELETIIEELPNTPVEKLFGPAKVAQRYQTTFDILKKATTLEQVDALWKESVKNREAYLIEKIKTTAPDITVLGYGHVQNLMSSLPESEYEIFIGTQAIEIKPSPDPIEQRPTTIEKKPYRPPTEAEISAKAKELYEKRRRLYDVKIDDFSELSDEKLIEIIGGREAVDGIVQDFGHASDYESYKQKNAGEAREFLLDRASYEHNQYGPFSTDAYLHGNGLNPINENAQNFDSKWGADAKKFLEDLSADQAKRELELQNQVRNFEGTRDLQIFKQIRDQLAKEHRNLYKVESFVEKQERLVQSLYETTPIDFFEQRLTDFDKLYNSYVETFPAGPAGSRANVVLDQVGEFQSLLNDAKGRIQKGQSLVEYHTKVVDLADRINANYEQLSGADQEAFRPFVDLVEETVNAVDEDQIRTALSGVDEEKLKATNKIAEETQKAIDKLPDETRNSAPIKKAMSQYKQLVEKTSGKFTKENYAPIVKQLGMLKGMVSSTRNANINARNSLITKSKTKLKIPLFDRFKAEIEHRFATNPVISGANGYLETAKTFLNERQAVIDQTRKLISEEGFEGRFSRYGGTFSLGLVGVISASPILKQYAQLSGNMYAYRAAVAIDGVSYGLIGSTAVAEIWITLKALNIIKAGLPTVLRFASISLQGFRAFAKTTLITIVISEAINLIAMSVLENIYESCSVIKYYGSSQLVLEKNVVNPDDTIKFMVYGTQRCDISQLSLVKKTESIEPDFLVGSGEKICAFDTNGCCVGISRIVAPPGTYTVKAVSGGHTFLSESTDSQPFTIKGNNDFVIFRSSVKYDSVRDSIQFSYANNLDSDVLVVFYITDDKGSFYVTNKKGKLVNQFPRISLPLKKHTTSADLGNYEEELGLKEVVKGNFVVSWAAYKTKDGKTPNLTPLDLSYPNEALKIQVK